MGGKSNEKHLIRLAWKVKELSDLNEGGWKLLVDVRCLAEKLQGLDCDWIDDNTVFPLFGRD